VEIKCQLDATDGFFIADLIACSTCFGHLYAHHQELKSIFTALNTTCSNNLYSTLELLIVGIRCLKNVELELLILDILVSETC